MNYMTERLFKGLAMRKAKQEQDRKEKIEAIKVLGEDIATVPTAYQQGECKISWIAPVPIKSSPITKSKKDGWGIERKVQTTSVKYDWSNWETPNEEVRAIWQGLEDILSGKREWPEKGEKILYGKQNTTVCPNCGKKGANKRLLQTRSADEAPTEILTCIHCGFTWRAKD